MASDYPEPPPPFTMHTHGANAASAEEQPTFGLGLHHADASPDPEDPQVEIKRPRACEPCRQLKVRCDPDPTTQDGSCKRCAKAGRPCIVTAPTRKRQKKTDSRVTELERKIDALTATLQASQTNTTSAGSSQLQSMPHNEPPSSRRWLKDDPNLAGNKRHHDGLLVSQYSRPDSPSAEQIQPHSHSHSTSKQWRGPFAGSRAPLKSDHRNDFVDVIDRGVIDVESAQAAFTRYVTEMADEMPMVVFTPDTTMGDVRRDKPALFLAIIAVSIGPFKKPAQLPLLSEYYHLIAERVVVKGQKSLELVQSLLVVSIWYMPPDNLEELKFYQLIHMAIVNAMDLGLNRRSNGDLKPLVHLREIISKRHVGPSTDLNGPEARRTWVGCYFLGIQVATALRRMHLVRWQPYMDECLQILESHPDALPSDRKVIWWAKLAFIMEQASVQLTNEDPQTAVSFADSKVRYTIKAFANQLAQYRRDIPEEFWTAPLAHTHYTINLFVHESAMGVDCRDNNIVNSSIDGLPTSAVAPFIDALTTCIHSIHQTLDILNTVDTVRLTCLPTLALARTAYPVVSLIKIYSLLTAPESRIGQVIDMQTLKVEYYLDKTITHYRAAAALDGGRVALKFGNILTMMRNWFISKKGNGPELREIFGTEMRSDTRSERQPTRPGTTPLQVLSELASGDPASGTASTNTLSHRPHSRPTPSYSHSPSSLNQDGANNTPTPGMSPYGPVGTPTRVGSMASAHSDPAPATVTPWSTSSSFSASIPGPHDPSQNTFYHSFPHTRADLSQTSYAGIHPSTAAMAGSQPGSYADMSTVGMSLTSPMGAGTEMGVDCGDSSSNSFLMLGNMMDEGLFAFPFPFEGNFQF
ncbi:Transcription factor [Penicillium hispanicum]|uniref:Transcription factor n=1 Tax=Penicillium hispanicum TaxID=1080232 RepID=UPI00253FDE87|nr:Transcription factor [Penicillium hispanicum]KAJ5580276.1 Transcription factor [Penicillium hispanicum]